MFEIRCSRNYKCVSLFESEDGAKTTFWLLWALENKGSEIQILFSSTVVAEYVSQEGQWDGCGQTTHSRTQTIASCVSKEKSLHYGFLMWFPDLWVVAMATSPCSPSTGRHHGSVWFWQKYRAPFMCFLAVPGSFPNCQVFCPLVLLGCSPFPLLY